MFSRDSSHWEQWCGDSNLSGLSQWIISCSRFVFRIVFGFCYSLPSRRIVFVVLDCLLGHLGFRLLELRKVVIVELQLKSLRIFQTLLNCCQVFISCVSLHTFIVVHHYFGMELSFIGLMRIKQSNQQGLKHCQAFDKGFTLHPSIMLTTGESEEVNKEESILEL